MARTEPQAAASLTGVVTRRAVTLLPLALLAARPVLAAAVLPTPASLARALEAALRAKQPLVVLASLDGCPYCEIVRNNYLAPLQRDERLPVVQLELAVPRPVLDFDGRPSSHDQLLRLWGVKAAPTVLFFGQGGREVAPRLVGASVDFYAAYLEQRLAAARRSLG